MMAEPTIPEKVESVFKWAGFKTVISDDIYGEHWVDPNGEVVTVAGYYQYTLPTPNDIEFLGYMDKYVFPKLQDTGYLITIEAKANEYKYNVELHNVNKGGVKYSMHQDSIAIALLNAVYEVVINGQ